MLEGATELAWMEGAGALPIKLHVPSDDFFQKLTDAVQEYYRAIRLWDGVVSVAAVGCAQARLPVSLRGRG